MAATACGVDIGMGWGGVMVVVVHWWHIDDDYDVWLCLAHANTLYIYRYINNGQTKETIAKLVELSGRVGWGGCCCRLFVVFPVGYRLLLKKK